MPVRGKILNCLKADYAAHLQERHHHGPHEGPGLRRGGTAARRVKDLNSFDLNNLRWSKVVICTDGDVDGFQIRTLILTMLYRLCPHPHPGGLCVYRGDTAV